MTVGPLGPDDVLPLLRENGGKWTLSADGKGLERNVRFKGFARTRAFIDAVCQKAEAAKHHPEWANVYDRVFIHLTTHKDRATGLPGLSTKDIEMATFCDSVIGDDDIYSITSQNMTKLKELLEGVHQQGKLIEFFCQELHRDGGAAALQQAFDEVSQRIHAEIEDRSADPGKLIQEILGDVRFEVFLCQAEALERFCNDYYLPFRRDISGVTMAVMAKFEKWALHADHMTLNEIEALAKRDALRESEVQDIRDGNNMYFYDTNLLRYWVKRMLQSEVPRFAKRVSDENQWIVHNFNLLMKERPLAEVSKAKDVGKEA
ncbi:hypothetical protein MMC13_005611 [Lambiella insularis]|nr:hypothetical protein [Lambiella insularis]